MSGLIPFDFEGRAVRVVTDDAGAPWFVAADVAELLEYRMASDMTRNLDDDERGTQIVRTAGGDQDMSVINESGLYSAILKSRKLEAQKFKRWVTREVLPSIRRTGSYTVPTIDPGLSTLHRAQALDMATNVADRICARFPSLGEPAQQVIFAKIVNPIAGDDVIPLPRLSGQTFTATQVGEILKISANKVGRLAKEHNLKTEEYGVFVLDKSASSVKQVSSFVYNQAGINRLQEILAPSGDLLGGGA